MRRAAALVALLGGLVVGPALLAACSGTGPAGGSSPSGSPAAPSGDPDGLVLRVSYTGGFAGPGLWSTRLPLISMYTDGRVLTEGPVPAIRPGPALPNLVVAHVPPAEVQRWAARALDAGIRETTDLGRPRIADAMSTVFTVVADGRTYERGVYALGEAASGPAPGLTPAQVAGRARLDELLSELSGLGGENAEPYRASTVAVFAQPWAPPDDEPEPPQQAWPGPALPGIPVPGRSGQTCVTATGAAAGAVLDAAARATDRTRWVTDDGRRWSVRFRPLLPDESGCADLP